MSHSRPPGGRHPPAPSTQEGWGETLPRASGTEATGRKVLSCGQGTGKAAPSGFRPLVAVERDAVSGGNEKRPDAVQAAARKGRFAEPPGAERGRRPRPGSGRLLMTTSRGPPARAGSGRPLPTPTPGQALPELTLGKQLGLKVPVLRSVLEAASS